MPVSGAFIPIFDVWDSFRYTVTSMMHKHHMSLTRVPVAGNGHTLPCAHYKLYTREYVRFLPQEHMAATYDVCASYMLLYT